MTSKHSVGVMLHACHKKCRPSELLCQCVTHTAHAEPEISSRSSKCPPAAKGSRRSLSLASALPVWGDVAAAEVTQKSSCLGGCGCSWGDTGWRAKV